MSKLELSVLKDSENIILGRREVRIELIHSKATTPKRSEAISYIAGKFKVDPVAVKIIKMETKRNTWVTVCSAYIYTSKQLAEKLTPKHLVIRDLPKEEKEKLKAEKKKISKTEPAKSSKK